MSKEAVGKQLSLRGGTELTHVLELPGDVFQVDVRRSEDILGIKYRTLEACITDTIQSFQVVGSQGR